MKDSWRVEYALTQVKGIGWKLSKKILKSANLDPAKRVSDLKKSDVGEIVAALEKHTLEGELVRRVKGDIQRLQVIGSYRGIRHQQGLPARGQRTKSNARTKRGKRRTVGSYKKEALAKMQQQKN